MNRSRALAAAAMLAGLAGAGLVLPRAGSSQMSLASDSAPVVVLDSVPCVGANDLARLLDATKFWRSDIRKLVLRAGDHTVKLTQDNPFVVVDDRTYRLPGRVRMRQGELQVPVKLFDFTWADTSGRRVRYDARARRLVLVPVGSVLALPQFTYARGFTRITMRMERPEDVRVASRGRSRFRLRFPGPFTAPLPGSFPPHSLVRAIRVLPGTEGSALELNVAAGAQAYRLEPDTAARELVFEVAPAPSAGLAWQRFAPEMPPGPRPLRVIVIDPGHGAADEGVVTEDGVKEKDLTLALARELRAQLARRLRARIVLTRDGDDAPSLSERAETANRARADVVLSLHFDGFPRPEARGVSAFVPPATYGAQVAAEGGPRGASPLVLIPWRDAATRYAVPSRELAEEVLTACDLRGWGPTRLREQLPYALVGVNAPGVLLECGMLTSPKDRERLTAPNGVRDLAQTIADAVESYQRTETRP